MNYGFYMEFFCIFFVLAFWCYVRLFGAMSNMKCSNFTDFLILCYVFLSLFSLGSHVFNKTHKTGH